MENEFSLEITQVATDLFLKLGFKSVTMDDVAAHLGISKKTLYKYFSNKETLIEASVDFVHEQIDIKFEEIINLNYNAIEENFILRNMFNELFKTEGDSPIYQLKKYYPTLFYKVRERESKNCMNFFKQNISKGIQTGYYHDNISIEHSSMFYYMLIFAINEEFQKESEVVRLELEALKYHVYAIATEKGKKEFEKQLVIQSENEIKN